MGSASPYASRYASRSAAGSSDTDRTNRAGTEVYALPIGSARSRSP